MHVHIFTTACILISAVTPEKARQILGASLLDGSLPLSYLKGMSLGVPRSGKTLCMKHIFGIECDRTSQSVQEVQSLAFEPFLGK